MELTALKILGYINNAVSHIKSITFFDTVKGVNYIELSFPLKYCYSNRIKKGKMKS